MGMLIKKTYTLMGFKVSLVTGSSDAIVRLEFEVTESHTTKTVQTWDVPASHFGLPPRLDQIGRASCRERV